MKDDEGFNYKLILIIKFYWLHANPHHLKRSGAFQLQ